MKKYFRGSNKSGPYFEGWYFKCQTQDGQSLALIPAFHISENGEQSASIQVVTDKQAWYMDCPASAFTASLDSLHIVIGENRFSNAGVHLNVDREGLSLYGKVEFGPFQTLKADIMGPFQWFANMECAHSVLSMRHTLRGQLEINNDVLDFNGGIGYVEADRGRSFPTSYLWTQCLRDNCSLMLSIATIPLGKEECMFILHGKTTRNGKSTMLDAIQHMLGDYSSVAPVELICKSDRAKNAEAPTSVLAKLKGRRFVTMSESDTAGKLDEATIKQYTGGEDITARELYQAAITFKPQFTMWLSCNDLPAVKDKSLFASDRVRVIEFNKHFTDAEQDKGLKDYFESPEAMKGIFTWLVAGYFKYRRFGLKMSENMRAVVKQYEKDNDLVLQFLEEKCEHTTEGYTKAKWFLLFNNSIKGLLLF